MCRGSGSSKQLWRLTGVRETYLSQRPPDDWISVGGVTDCRSITADRHDVERAQVDARVAQTSGESGEGSGFVVEFGALEIRYGVIRTYCIEC